MYRELQVYINGVLAGISYPYFVIYTGRSAGHIRSATLPPCTSLSPILCAWLVVVLSSRRHQPAAVAASDGHHELRHGPLPIRHHAIRRAAQPGGTVDQPNSQLP